jgi:glycine/D-amino acid oxidase-like deaminating enzyme
MAHARGRYLGLDTEMLTMVEAKKLPPMLEEQHFVGAMLNTADGNLDPNGTTNAYAKSGRIVGAKIYQRCRVMDLKPRKNATLDVITANGNIRAEHVVNCGGLWAHEVGRMVGLELPVLAMEHMYLVTEDLPDVVAYKGTWLRAAAYYRLQVRHLHASGATGHRARHLRAGLRAVATAADASARTMSSAARAASCGASR